MCNDTTVPFVETRTEADMKRIMLILPLLATVFLTGCFADPELDFEDVSFVEIMTEDNRVTVRDEVAVAELTEEISELDYLRAAEPEGGYIYTAYYTITWYNSDGVAIESVDIADENGYQIAHDGVVYTVDADLAVDMVLIARLAVSE